MRRAMHGMWRKVSMGVVLGGLLAGGCSPEEPSDAGKGIADSPPGITSKTDAAVRTGNAPDVRPGTGTGAGTGTSASEPNGAEPGSNFTAIPAKGTDESAPKETPPADAKPKD
jgi:hypothetical protein